MVLGIFVSEAAAVQRPTLRGGGCHAHGAGNRAQGAHFYGLYLRSDMRAEFAYTDEDVRNYVRTAAWTDFVMTVMDDDGIRSRAAGVDEIKPRIGCLSSSSGGG